MPHEASVLDLHIGTQEARRFHPIAVLKLREKAHKRKEIDVKTHERLPLSRATDDLHSSS